MRNKNVVINIPSDGLVEETYTQPGLSKKQCRQNVKRYIFEFLDNTVCGRIFFNVCYKRSVVPGNIADSYLYDVKRRDDGLPVKDDDGNVIKVICPEPVDFPLNRGYRELEKLGIDIIEMAVEEARSYGVEVWFSARMNDHHCPDDRGFNSSFAYDRANELGISGSREQFDYTKVPVQNYYINYFKEICENYDIDGLELDFLRTCPIMGEVNDENVKIINDFVSSVKRTIDAVAYEKDRKIAIAARVYPDEDTNLGYGLDTVGWIASGLIDILTVEGWYIPTVYDFPVEKWRESIRSRNIKNNPYTLLCGTDWGVKCERTPGVGRSMWLSLEQFKGFASSAYSRGADGIYIFNHFNTNDDYHTFNNGGLYSCYIDENGLQSRVNVLKHKINSADSIISAQKGPRCYVNTYTDIDKCPYPVLIDDFNSFEFEINTVSKPETGYWRVIVGIDADCDCKQMSVKVNDVETALMGEVPKRKDFVFNINDKEALMVNHVSETSEKVVCYNADINFVKDKFNKVSIFSKNNLKCNIRWIEVQTQSQSDEIDII